MQKNKTTVEQDVAKLIADHANPLAGLFGSTNPSGYRELRRVVIALACGDAIDVDEIKRQVEQWAENHKREIAAKHEDASRVYRQLVEFGENERRGTDGRI